MSNLKAQNSHNQIQSELEKSLGKGRIQTNFNLSPYLTLRLNTMVDFYFEAETKEDLLQAKRASLLTNIPLLILGGGSNMAIIHKHLNVLAVKNRYMHLLISNNLVKIGSGYPTSRLVKATAEAGLEGLEYHYGLPGTIGGAIYMNSKWTKPLSYIGDHLLTATIIDKDGNLKKVDKDYFDFAYDFSNLQKSKEILLDATFQLKKNDPSILKERLKFAQNYRKLTQPSGKNTCGCFFQNVNGQSAGKLIDHSGLKGINIGKFFISEKHANFIINEGGGNPLDLMKLIKLIKTKVKEKFGVELKEEVVII